LQAALSATSRADASLSTLMRAVRDLTVGVSSAREANVALVSELGALADLLGAANERQLALKNRVTYLEQSLERAKKESTSERAYILEQQDAFIAGLLEEHERVVAELRKEPEPTRERMSQRPTATPGSLTDLPAQPASPSDSLANLPAQTVTEPAPAPAPDNPAELDALRQDLERLLADRERTREALLKLQAQRDEAQAAVVRLTRERDLARAEGAQNRIGDAVRQAIPVHTPTPTPAGRMAATLPGSEGPRDRSPSSPVNQPLQTQKPPSSRKNAPESAPVLNERSARTTQPMPVGVQRPRAPALDLPPRELRTPSPPPEELRAALHAPTTPLPPPPVLTPTPVTPRGPEVRLNEPEAPVAPPTSKKPKLESSVRPTGGYSLTEGVAPERVDTTVVTTGVSRPPRR
jgi:predicted  nucleic acid-binding Zn-ribbon protein